MPAVSSGADIDTDELVDETGVEPKDIELIMSQVSMQQTIAAQGAHLIGNALVLGWGGCVSCVQGNCL